MLKEFNKHSAVYKTKDSIDNFKFKIKFCSINSLIKMPKFLCQNSSNEDIMDPETHRSGASAGTQLKMDSDIEEIEIAWQQKILSPVEIELYRYIENCTTDVQKIYHNWIKSEDFSGDVKKIFHIFTYVSDDNFINSEDICISRENDNHVLKDSEGKSEMMYVFVDLDPHTLLFWIKWEPLEAINTLTVYPDFNDFKDNPYTIELNTDSRYLYKYSVENISLKRDLSSKLHYGADLPKFSSLSLGTTHTLFDMPPKQNLRVLFLFEIQEAEQFEYDNLHVRYIVMLPDMIEVESGRLHGSTHSSFSTGNVCKFGYCFELCFTGSPETICRQNIKIFFELISTDSWLRERTEGYTSANFILKPRKQIYTLDCFRVEYGFWSNIERFFIGGRRKFDFENYVDNHIKHSQKSSLESESLETFFNRYGLNTTTAGKLVVKGQIVVQSNSCFVPEIFNQDQRMDKLNDLVKAYRSAKTRLEATKSQ